jgi:hypothetical protein
VTPPTTIPKALAALKAARCPEDILGREAVGIKDLYRDWAKRVHPDTASTAALKLKAEEAFHLLTKLHDQADAKVARGTYGDMKPSILATLSTKTATYDLTEVLSTGDIADVYGGECKGKPVWAKVCRAPVNNDLMKAEADLLASVPATFSKPELAAYYPTLLDSFEVQVGKTKRRANVFAPLPDGAVSLAEVRRAYPDGLDPKAAAWMWNRLLEALHLSHVAGYVHANVTPDRVYIVPDSHVGIVTDLCYAVKIGSPARAISPAYKGCYPEELLAKRPLDASTDLYMAAHCMNGLLGADVGSRRIPAGTPVAIAGLLRACWLGRAHRTSSAKELHAAFKEVRRGLRWPKGFLPFTMTPPAVAAV